MKVLVTGGAGHIGAATVHRLVELGADVTVVDITPDPARLSDLGSAVVYIRADLSDQARMQRIVKAAAPECIYHMGAMLNAASEADPAASFRINVQGTLALLDTAELLGVPKVFFASSRGTYGQLVGDTVDDLTLQRPDRNYGWGKLYCEGMGRWYRANRGVDFRAIRYPTILAPGVRTGGHWAPVMIEDALAGRPHVSQYGARPDAGNFLYIKDAARATVELMQAPAEDIAMVVYNVVGINDMVTAEALGTYLEGRFPGFSVTYNTVPDTKPKTRHIDDGFARREWGWVPEFGSLETIVDQFARDLG